MEKNLQEKNLAFALLEIQCPSVRLSEFQEPKYQVSSVQTCKNHRDKSKSLSNLYMPSVIERKSKP